MLDELQDKRKRRLAYLTANFPLLIILGWFLVMIISEYMAFDTKMDFGEVISQFITLLFVSTIFIWYPLTYFWIKFYHDLSDKLTIQFLAIFYFNFALFWILITTMPNMGYEIFFLIPLFIAIYLLNFILYFLKRKKIVSQYSTTNKRKLFITLAFIIGIPILLVIAFLIFMMLYQMFA